MQYYIGEKDGKLFARPPGGFEPQTWFITKNMATENNSNYMYVTAIRLEAEPTASNQQDCQV